MRPILPSDFYQLSHLLNQCHPERSEATAERSRRTPLLPAVVKTLKIFSFLGPVRAGNPRAVVPYSAAMGYFDSIAACAALPLSMTVVLLQIGIAEGGLRFVCDVSTLLAAVAELALSERKGHTRPGSW
jgi:hypothetical protein